MPPRRNPLPQALLYGLVRAYTALIGVLPLPAARAITILFARAALALVPRLHRVGRQNLDLAYGDSMPPREKRRILRQAMDNLAIVAAEFAHGPRAARHHYHGYARVRGTQHVDTSRGAIFISGHIGNWEWFAGAIAVHLPGLAEVVRPLDFPPMNRYVDATRRASGADTIPKQAAAKELITRLKEGRYVGLMVDQSPRDSAAPTTFFGHDCWTTVAPAILAARTGCPIHFVTVERLPDYTYEITIDPAMPMQATGNHMADLKVNVQRTQDDLEAFIRRQPGQWLWFHRRWKSRARLAVEWAERVAKADQAEGRN